MAAAVFFLSKTEVEKETKIEAKKEIKTVETTPKTIKKTPAQVEKKVPPAKVDQTKASKTTEENSTKNTPIDIMGKNDSFIYSKPKSEIEQIMQEQQKINSYKQKKHSNNNKENWSVDYETGLEDGSIEKLKSAKSFKADMINGKVEFSKSF